jgi:hypothetical protein
MPALVEKNGRSMRRKIFLVAFQFSHLPCIQKSLTFCHQLFSAVREHFHFPPRTRTIEGEKETNVSGVMKWYCCHISNSQNAFLSWGVNYWGAQVDRVDVEIKYKPRRTASITFVSELWAQSIKLIFASAPLFERFRGRPFLTFILRDCFMFPLWLINPNEWWLISPSAHLMLSNCNTFPRTCL